MRLVQEEHQEQQAHQVHQVHLTLQQISRLAAGFIITGFFIFIAGFYWGKKSITETALEEATERLLTDKIYAALYKELEHISQSAATQDQTQEQVQEQAQAQEQIMYSLHIGMFSTRKAAQACVEKLKLLNCPAHIQQRSSATAQGKHYIWYEVVTPAYTTHGQLEILQKNIEKKITQQTHIVAQKEILKEKKGN